MKLGSLKEGGRDGTLIVVSRDLTRARARHRHRADTLQRALEDWSNTAPRLNALSDALNAGERRRRLRPRHGRAGRAAAARLRVRRRQRLPAARRARAPRARRRSAGELLRRPADVPGRQRRLPTARAIRCAWSSEDYGIDLEAEVVVVTDDVPMAVTPERAAAHIQLVGLVNDVSLRNLIPGRARQGLRLPAVQAALGAVAGVRHAGRARRRLAATARCTCRCSRTSTANGSARPKRASTCSSTSPSWSRTRRRRGRCRPAPSSARARSPTRTPAGRLVLRRAAHGGNAGDTASRSRRS